YRPPEESHHNGVTVRNDTGVYEGGEISIWYDPMIAKLVTHAATREAAIDAQAMALDAFAIEGIRHNIPFLTALMAHPRWRGGRDRSQDRRAQAADLRAAHRTHGDAREGSPCVARREGIYGRDH